jgi:hypothetical protein
MWPPEEMDLRDPAFLDTCAQAIADGVVGWVASVRSLSTP